MRIEYTKFSLHRQWVVFLFFFLLPHGILTSLPKMKYKNPAVSIGLSRSMVRKMRKKDSTKKGLTQLTTQKRKQEREILGMDGKKDLIKSALLSSFPWPTYCSDHNPFFSSFKGHTLAWVLLSRTNVWLAGWTINFFSQTSAVARSPN